MNKKIVHNLKNYILLIPIMLVIVLFIIMPLINMITDSIKINDKYNYNSFEYGTDNFKRTFDDNLFQRSIINTSILLLIVSPLALIGFFFISIGISSIANKIIKNKFMATIFLQLFISSYGIGMSFLLLFSNKQNVLNSIFSTSISWNSSTNAIFPILALSIFFIWRMSVISIVLFVFAISRIDSRNERSVKLDNIGFFKKVQIVYLPHMKNNLVLQLYIFIYESLFMYPTIFIDPFIVNGQTIMYYIVNKLQNGSINQWNIAAAASTIVLIYIISISTLALFVKTIINLYQHRRFKSEK